MEHGKIDQLRWIDEEPEPVIYPKFTNQDDPKGQRTKVKMLTDELVIPLGLVATGSCLFMGLLNLYRGNKMNQQFFMRGRVICQGLCLVAIAVGAYSSAKARQQRSSESRRTE